MRFKKVLLLAGAFILSLAVFFLNAATKNIDLESSWLQQVRTLFIFLSFAAVAYYVHLRHREHAGGIVQVIGSVAVYTGVFLGIYLLISFLPLKGFETRDLTLFPRDYQTIFFSSIFSIVAGIFSIAALVSIKTLVLYKRKKSTLRNFVLLIVSILTASVSQLFSKPLQESVLSGILIGVAVLMIVTNSFRLAWIAYLPRREKIYSLLYSLLSFFGFLVILIVFSQEAGWAEKGIHYYSSALFTFVQLTAIFGAVYFGMSFVSTLFHLPTAEAFDRKQTEISSLHNLSRLITQVFDLQDLAETATKMTTEVVQASAVWLEIIPSDGTVHKSGLMSRRNIEENEIAILLSEQDGSSLRKIVCQTKKVLMIDDVSEDKRTKHLPRMRKVGSLLIVPLLSHQEVIGILYASKEMEYGFDQDDVDILSGFADQVAIAIENARLIERSLEKERLQRELMLAQEMQKRLLPQELPTFGTVEMRAVSSPALEVGGDYYDYVRISDRRVGIVIGDVSGKGVGAAFYMAEVKGIFQSLAKIFPAPRDFMMKANEALVSSIDKRSFISLIYATIDVVSGELIVARAGHCPLLYVTESSREYIRPQGLGLGMKTGAIFNGTIEEKKIMMKSGDVCVFYTDGVTESRSSGGEEFGYERLLEIVAQNRHRTAEEIKEAIIHSVWNYTDAQGYHDDLTIFVLKWR